MPFTNILIINRVHLSLGAQFAQLQSSTTKFLLMLSGIVESKILLVLVQFIPHFLLLPPSHAKF